MIEKNSLLILSILCNFSGYKFLDQDAMPTFQINLNLR